MNIVDIRKDGAPSAPLTEDAVTAIYGCADCPDNQQVQWSLRLETAEGHEPDIVAFYRHTLKKKAQPSNLEPPQDLRVNEFVLTQSKS